MPQLVTKVSFQSLPIMNLCQLACVSTIPLSGRLESELYNLLDGGDSLVIPKLRLSQLVDDNFIAGFCFKGEVTVVPLIHTEGFDLVVDKSILTVRMSPQVYSSFGLTAKKLKCGGKEVVYEFNTSLQSPSFRRSSRLHVQLRQFLTTCNASISQHDPPSMPCLVRWKPRESSDSSSLDPIALAAFLDPDYLVVKPRLVTLPSACGPIRLPSLTTTTTNASDGSHPIDDDIEPAATQLAFRLLSYRAAGLQASLDSFPFNEPYHCPLVAAQSAIAGLDDDDVSTWKLDQLNVTHIEGLFLPDQVDQIKLYIKSLVKPHAENGQIDLVFVAISCLNDNDSLLSSSPSQFKQCQQMTKQKASQLPRDTHPPIIYVSSSLPRSDPKSTINDNSSTVTTIYCPN